MTFGTAARALLCAALLTCLPAQAAPNHMAGRINNVSFVGNMVLITLDTGLPDNCTGTRFGWMVVPANSKSIQAFVIGLRLSGSLRETSLVVYTTGRDATGYCQIDQIDPVD